MRIISGGLLLIMLMLSPAVSAQDDSGQDESTPIRSSISGPEGDAGPEECGSPGPARHGRHKKFGKKGMMGPGGREAGLQFKEFRKEVRELGREIRENKLMIQSLEEELEMVEPGIPRAEVRKKLNEYCLREAELQMELARKRVDFTRRSRDMAQKRYDQARLAMERVKDKLKKKYPALAAQLEQEINSPGNPGVNPEF